MLAIGKIATFHTRGLKRVKVWFSSYPLLLTFLNFGISYPSERSLNKKWKDQNVPRNNC